MTSDYKYVKPPADIMCAQDIEPHMFYQVFDMVDVGLVILDRDLRVCFWNHWMQMHSDLTPERIIGSYVCEEFPNLKRPRFLNSCKAVFTFGNFCFFSQKLHRYLFPFEPVSTFDTDYEHMQQNCTMGPLRNDKGEITHLFISVHDVTETVKFEQRLVELNMIDALTGINNRRSFEIHLGEDFSSYRRYHIPFGVLLLDIDHFKNVNDTYGHDNGDRVLKALGQKLLAVTRKDDVKTRWGGEEFVLLTRLSEPDKLIAFGERLRTIIEKTPVEIPDRGITINFTISVGVTLSRPEDDKNTLLKRCDEMLYKSKVEGRNRVSGVF